MNAAECQRYELAASWFFYDNTTLRTGLFFTAVRTSLADVYDIVAAYFAGKPLPTPVNIQRLL
jgi:hypothetical protein